MPKLSLPCPRCAKPLVLKSETKLSNSTLRSFTCGHAFAVDQLPTYETDSLELQNLAKTKTLRPYQIEGVEFILKSLSQGAGCVLADQMRLGKTNQALMAALNHPNFKDLDFNVLVQVRAANVWQWVREIRDWCDNLPNAVWVIEGTKNWIPPGFKFYVISMDTFSRQGTCKACKHQFHEEGCSRCLKAGKSCRVCIPAGDAISDQLLEFGFKLCIVDEAHSFKNTDSQRSRALTAFLKNIERSELEQTWTFTCPMPHKESDFTKVLNVQPGETVKDAYKRASLKTHPDVGGSGDAFRKVNEAYLALQAAEGRSTEKASWTEKVTIQTSTAEAMRNVSKTSHCPICGATVQQSAALHLETKRNCGIIMLTGTPIKNRADEYFVPLNLIAPEQFPSQTAFRKTWIGEDGRRINPCRLEAFKERIAPFVLRREKEDIYKDLPSMNRIFTVIEVADERLRKAYNMVLDEMEADSLFKDSKSHGGSFFDSIGKLQKLRRICGLAKVNWVADYAETFLYDSDKAKLAIGYHHLDVRDALSYQLTQFGTCKLDGADSPQTKDRIAHKYFRTAPEQVLLLGETACKEGLELVYIENALVTERQWSSAEEEQFEYRFYNPDLEYLKKLGLENKRTQVEYIVAKGTIDQFFYELVEEKRAIFGETIATHWDMTTDSGSFKDLVERTLATRL